MRRRPPLSTLCQVRCERRMRRLQAQAAEEGGKARSLQEARWKRFFFASLFRSLLIKGRTAHTLDPHGPMHVNPAILTTPFILSDCYDQYTHYTPKPGNSPTYPCFTQVPYQNIPSAGQGDQAADYHSQSLIYPIFHAPFPPQPSYPKINLYVCHS